MTFFCLSLFSLIFSTVHKNRPSDVCKTTEGRFYIRIFKNSRGNQSLKEIAAAKHAGKVQDSHQNQTNSKKGNHSGNQSKGIEKQNDSQH